MSAVLHCGGELRSTTYGGLAALLATAQRHGWRPAGTTLQDPAEPWAGGYLTSDFQQIAEADAAGLAEALGAAAIAETDARSAATLREWATFFLLGAAVIA